jgi:WD40 repeat protein
MNKFRSPFFRWFSLAVLVGTSVGWDWQTFAVAQERPSSFQVGDLIEFEFHGEMQQQVVKEVNSAGWLKVDADFGGRKTWTFVIPDRAKLVRSVRQAALPEEYRMWTDATGKFSVEATVYEINENEVKLLKRDRKVVPLPLDKLSESDREYLKERREKLAAEQNPFDGGEPPKAKGINRLRNLLFGDSPRPTGEEKPKPKVFADGELPISGSGRLVKPENEVTLDVGAWIYSPNAARAFSGIQSIPLPESLFATDQQKFTTLQFSTSGHAGESFVVQRNNHFQDFTEVVIVDGTAKTAARSFSLPFKGLNDVIVSPSGNTVVTLHQPFAQENGGIVFWRVQNDELVPHQAWPFAGPSRPNRFVANSSWFVDEDKLLTIGTHLALWDIPNSKCIYSVSAPGVWAISRDYSHVAFLQNKVLWLLRISDGKIVGKIQGDERSLASLRNLDFSPDGRSLAASSGQRLLGFDLTNGNLKFSFALEEPINSVKWADNSLVLIDNHHVIDPTLEVAVWFLLVPFEYRSLYAGSTTWVATPDRVFSFELINDNRRAAIAENTRGLQVDDVHLIRPGASIALSTNLTHLDAKADETTAALRKRLETLGYVIDESAPLRLEAVVERHQEIQELVRGHMRPVFDRVQERVRYTPHTTRLKLTLNNDVLWQISARYSADGPFLELLRNETAQDAVERLSQPDPAFFTNAAIPRQMTRLPKDRRAGRSEVTASGLQ